MSDRFSRISSARLLQLILQDFQREQRILGIPEGLFYRPRQDEPFAGQRFGHPLGTPLGVAAGPHTQMAQNIVAAWLCGARYIELKTIQTLDELEISKPCIDMQDEGYNCEWSQELRIPESLDEYITAWVIIHVLHHRLGFPGRPDVVFNMSAGYNMEGILQPNVQFFFDGMADASLAIAAKRAELAPIYPATKDLDIPSCLSDNVTLSTMHGCPPHEIEKIGLYLIEQKKLHTVVKLNPTLLGAEQLRELLNQRLGYTTEVPDEAFAHDLKYPEAVRIITSLQQAAARQQLCFGLKLTNTLESVNNRTVFNANEKMMYMSGRALHLISVSLADRLQKEFSGTLDISFSGGADYTNISDLLACGLSPVTVCSDLLKPGGYGRLGQYLDEIRKSMEESSSPNADDRVRVLAGTDDLPVARMKNLHTYVATVLESSYYRNNPYQKPDIKTRRKLGWFDCIAAPCTDTCPTNQHIPQYMFHAARGSYDQGLSVILDTNPLPNVCGQVCDHTCHSKCTRINYDQSLRIREVKRFLAEEAVPQPPAQRHGDAGRVAVIGAGPSGLSAAYYLHQAGFSVTVYEARDFAGGMVADAIPAFRLDEKALHTDIRNIGATGVEIRYGQRIDENSFAQLRNDFQYVYLAVGAQRARRMRIPGEELPGVLDPLRFLSDVRRGKRPQTGNRILVIGGGNTAMDVARTAKRLAGPDAQVQLVYRRTRYQMPADPEEIEACLNDGIELTECVAPVAVSAGSNGTLVLTCRRTQITSVDASGRMGVAEIAGSEFDVPATAIIPAVGQEADLSFLAPGARLQAAPAYETNLPGVFWGGDLVSGGGSIIRAVADGRKMAEEIIRRSGRQRERLQPVPKGISVAELMQKRARRSMGMPWHEHQLDYAHPFSQVSETPEPAVVEREAERCLYCDELCNICVTVCPNRANFYYEQVPQEIPVFHLEPDTQTGKVTIRPMESLSIAQKVQVANLCDFCNECGNCATFCPTAGRPFADKPRICLSRECFALEDHAFYFHREQDTEILLWKEGGNVASLEKKNNQWLFEDDAMQLVLSLAPVTIVSLRFHGCEPAPADTLRVAEMIALHTGLSASPLFML